MPENMAVPAAILVIQLEHPVLMPQREKQVAVRCPLYGVRMSPIISIRSQEVGRTSAVIAAGFSKDGGPCHVEMIKSVPCPEHVKVRVQDDDHVANHINGSRTLNIRQDLFHTCKRGYIAVRQPSGLVVKHSNLALAHRGNLPIHCGGVGLLNRPSGKVEDA